MSTKERLNVNLDKELKDEVAKKLSEIGLDFTTAINIYFKQIVYQGKIPFELTGKKFYSIEEIAGSNWRGGLDDIEDEWEWNTMLN